MQSLILALALMLASVTVQANAMRESVYRTLESARGQIESGALESAIALLQQTAGQSSLTVYEQAQLLNLHGYALSLQGQDLAAMERYRELVALADLPEGMLQSAYRNLVQLSYRQEAYGEALAWLDRLPPEVLEADYSLQRLRAHCLYLGGDYAAAARQLETTAAREPDEATLNLLRAAYQQLEDYPKVARTLERLVSRFPTMEHLRALATVYGLMDRPHKQLALLESLLGQGALADGRDWQLLVSLYLRLEMPWRAARTLGDGLDRGVLTASDSNLRYLAQAWFQANENERALTVLERLARQTSDGEAELLMARTHLRRLDWSAAARSLEQALAKQVADQANAHLLLGIARLQGGELGPARQALARAEQFPSTRAKARQWLSVVDQRDGQPKG